MVPVSERGSGLKDGEGFTLVILHKESIREIIPVPL